MRRLSLDKIHSMIDSIMKENFQRIIRCLPKKNIIKVSSRITMKNLIEIIMGINSISKVPMLLTIY